jgi:AraC-like DNA-binding protein
MLTNSLPFTGSSAFDTIPFIRGSNSGTSTQPRRRERADRRRSNLGPAPRGYADGDLEVREELLSRLLADEEESLNRLHNIVSPVGLRILFFDERGRLVGRYGSGTNDDHQRAYAERTFNWVSAEKVKQAQGAALVGVTEIQKTEETRQTSFSLEHGRTIVIDCPPSISTQIPNLGCLAAPIFDADGRLLGFLDVLPTNGDLTGEASTLARTVMCTTARAIEERSFRKRYRREWTIALAPPDGSGRGILLAVDGQQRIVGADQHARSTLSAKLGSSPTLWALFEKDAGLFQNRSNGDMHTALATIGGEQIWTAIVTPPEAGASHQHSTEYANLHSRPRLDSIGCFRRSAPRASSVGGLTPRALQRIREYIKGHLAENIELEALADIAGLSKWHFARAFKRSVGTPPHFYLIQRRLERAQELLAETDLSLGQIALKSGFSDQSHFSRCFRMFLGITPRSFRWSKR